MEPANECTANFDYGCMRTAGAGGNAINVFQSARVRTVKSFSFKYGRVEFRAKLPVGNWLWPALWLLPVHQEYGNWPASGEIDVMESRGNLNYPKEHGGGPETFGSTLHWGPAYGFDPFEKTHAEYNHPTLLSDDFHTYGLIWTEDSIKTYIDDEANTVLNVDITNLWEKGNFPSNMDNPWKHSNNSNAPFDKEFYIIMNVAVGGTSGYFPDGVGGKTWTNKSPTATTDFWNSRGAWMPSYDFKSDKVDLQVDSVKVWSFA